MKINTLKSWMMAVLVLVALSAKNAYADQHQVNSGPQIYHTAEPGRLRNTFENAISNAQNSILIFTFTFSDRNFIELLNRKAEEGVDVVVVINKNHKNSLSIYGSKKLKIFTRYEGEGRVHHKILMVDDRDVWLGSANFSSGAFSSQENLVVGVQSPDLASALRQEAAVFQYGQKRSDHETPKALFGSQEIELCLLPHSNSNISSVEKSMNTTGKQRLLTLIKGAKRRIRIGMMVWTDPELEAVVLAAHQRGVHVEVLLEDMQDKVAWNLKGAGIAVSVNPHLNLMHNKFMLVDDTTLVNGSANWSRSSFSRNDESFLILKNLDREQVTYMDEYWADLLNR